MNVSNQSVIIIYYRYHMYTPGTSRLEIFETAIHKNLDPRNISAIRYSIHHHIVRHFTNTVEGGGVITGNEFLYL